MLIPISTVRYPGGLGSFKKEKNSPSKPERKKKNHPPSGQEKNNSPSKWPKINTGGCIEEEKNHPQRCREEKQITSQSVKKKKKIISKPNFLTPLDI